MSGVSLHYGPGAWTDEHGVTRWKRRWRSEDGRDWHEPATGQEIADLPGDALVIVGPNGSPRPKGEYDGLVIAGSPFLPAIAHLIPVFIEGEDPAYAER